MALSSLWKLAVDSSPAVSVAADLCKRVRYPSSDCARCRDICPEGALSLHPEPRVGPECSGCGLCVNTCPTDVFRPLLHSQTDLLRKTYLIADRRSSAKPARLHVRCQRGEQLARDDLSIPCLGSLTENVLVGAALAGFEQFVLVKGHCAECPLSPGESLIRGLLERTRSLLASLNLESVELTVEEHQRSQATALSRQELLTRIRSRFQLRSASTAPQGSETHHHHRLTEAQAETVPPTAPRRVLLRRLVEGLAPADLATVETGPADRWARLRIDEQQCSACGTCVAVCPTGALSIATENERAVLRFDAATCTNCGLCYEACDEGAVSKDQEWSIADLARGELRVLAEVPLRACAGCGDSIGHGETPLCPTCERRGVHPPAARESICVR